MTATAPAHAAQRAYDHTKRAILRGELAGGTWLSEGRICEELGISRTPVHEAFLRLAAERLLTLSARKGAIVAPLGPREGRDLLEMRRAVELTAARRVIADRIDTARVHAVLDPLLEAQREHLDRDDLEAFVEVDDAFHHAVIMLSGNPITAQCHDLLHDRQQRLRHQMIRINPEDLREAWDDHVALAGHLADGDADAYAAVLDRHVERNQGAL